jgi:glutathione S-transferase
MIVHGSTLSPYVRKVMAFGAEKGLKLTLDGTRSGPEFERASPFGKMPGFTDGDFAISDSTAIVTYLDAKYPEPNLIPLEPAARARTIWWEEYMDTMLMGAQMPLFLNRFVFPRLHKRDPDHAIANKAEREDLPPLWAHLERALPDSGFLVEDRLTLADIAIASPFATIGCIGVRPCTETYPKLCAFLAKMHARPSFAVYLEGDRALVEKMGGPVAAAA